MISEKNKASRVLKELVNYFIEEQMYTLHIDFELDEEKLDIKILCETDHEPHSFKRLLNDLNIPREIEADEYYNALLGSHNKHQDYTHLGKAIDAAEGNFQDNHLYLHVVRYLVKD